MRQPSFTGERGANSRGQSRPGVFQLLRFPDDGDRLIGVKVRLALVPCGLAQVKITGRPKPSAKPASQYAPSLPCVRSYGSLREKSAPSRSGERSALLPYYRPSAELGEEAGLTQPYSKFQRNISLFQKIRSTSSSVMTSAIRPSFVVRGHLLNSHMGCHSQCHGPQCRVTAVILHTSAYL